MTDSPRRGDQEPFQPYGDGRAGYTDPAYASQAPYGPTYQSPAAPAPTERLPEYSAYGYDPNATGQYGTQSPPPDGPKAPRWLWAVAGVAVLAVVGLVITLVIVNSSSQRTVVAPLPPMPDSTVTTPKTTPPTTTSRTPRTPTTPVPLPPPTAGTSAPGAMQTVVYEVAGDGRAINITYVDTGGVLQTEFNVTLPWSKEVQLGQPAEDSASVSIINIGNEVDCSITVDGDVVQQLTGSGLTICTAMG